MPKDEPKEPKGRKDIPFKHEASLSEHIQWELEAIGEHEDWGEAVSQLTQDQMDELVEEVILRLDDEVKDWVQDFLDGNAQYVCYQDYTPPEEKDED